MNRGCVRLSAVVLSLCIWQTTTGSLQADDKKPMTPEEERLQRFWHNYSHALKQYYTSLLISSAAEGEVDESRINWENYEKIKCGMGLSEVVAILGPGRRVGGHSFDYVWTPKKASTLIRVTFDDNGRVGSRSQIGLGARN